MVLDYLCLAFAAIFQQPHWLLSALKSLSKTTGGGRKLVDRSSLSVITHLEDEQKPIALNHLVRTATACRKIHT